MDLRNSTTKVASVGAVAALGAALMFGVGPGAASAHDLVAGQQTSASTPDSTAKEKAPSPELRAALEKARQLEGKERRAALAKIRADVKAGTYGEEAKKAAERRSERRDKLAERLPADLRKDVKELKGLKGDEREAARKKIEADAAKGEYGKKIERLAKLFGGDKA